MLKIGTKIRDKETGMEGVIAGVADYVEMYYISIPCGLIWVDAERVEEVEDNA